MPVVGSSGTLLTVETSPGSGLYADLTGYLLHGSMALKFNTLDLALLDPPVGSVQLTAGVKIANPAWSGSIVSATSSDPVDRRNNHMIWTITATNANVLPNDTAPFDLSDLPVAAPFDLLLEDGSGHLMIEDGTDWAPGALLLEGAYSQGYEGLSVQRQTNPGSPNTALGRCTVKTPGLRPGNNFKLTSLNQGYAGAPFQITQAMIHWPALSNLPIYSIEFGDVPQTLATWTQVTAPVPVAAVAPPAVAFVPAGPVTYGTARAGYHLWATGGGIVTIASASFTVSPPPGHTMTVQVQGAIDARMRLWDNYVAAPRRGVRAILSGGIYTGAWQELPFALTRAVYDVSSASGIALASGTYTVSLQINTVEYNQMEVFSGWVQTAVVVV